MVYISQQSYEKINLLNLEVNMERIDALLDKGTKVRTAQWL